MDTNKQILHVADDLWRGETTKYKVNIKATDAE